MDRGKESEQDAGGEGNGQSEAEHAPIERGDHARGMESIADPRNVAGREREQQPHSPCAEDETADTSGKREHDALSEKLAHDAAAAGA